MACWCMEAGPLSTRLCRQASGSKGTGRAWTGTNGCDFQMRPASTRPGNIYGLAADAYAEPCIHTSGGNRTSKDAIGMLSCRIVG